MLKPPHLITLISMCVVVSGCTVASTSVSVPNMNTEQRQDTAIHYSAVDVDSDFTPPKGRAQNPPPASAGERRLLIARSTDGVHFAPSDTVLTDQGNVPDAVVEPNGTIHVYYIGQSIQVGKEENTVRATSRDNGDTWTFEKLVFKNWPQPRDPSDPDVVLLDDGTYRMYYTTSLSDASIGIAYAESLDGITFTYRGESLKGSAGNVIDSTTFFYNGKWHMYVLQEKKQGQLYATSTNGTDFSIVSQQPIRLPGALYVISNQLIENTTLRMFGFSLADKNIRTFTSTDGVAWTLGDIALEGDEEATLGSNYIQDSTVAKLSDGNYLMIYVSEIPK